MSRNSAISATIQPIATTIIRPCISSNCLIIKDSRITISIFTISEIICSRVGDFFIVFRLDELILRDGCLEGGREREERRCRVWNSTCGDKGGDVLKGFNRNGTIVLYWYVRTQRMRELLRRQYFSLPLSARKKNLLACTRWFLYGKFLGRLRQ